MKISLPIDPYLEKIQSAHAQYATLLVKASPGSGKTTRLPWALAKNSHQKILVLEPRRLAAKLAAERIAFEENFRPGAEVGYHFRFEKKFGPETKVIFYTEGTFLKRLMSDPDLLDIGTVVLDEFHERHLETDVALGFLLGLQKKRGLKLVLMSATLDTEVTSLLMDSHIIDIEVPRFPVKLHYLPNQPSVLSQTLEQKIRGALERVETKGDVLVFVPGMREMLKVQSYLGDRFGEVLLLHADLSKEEQELALSERPLRKIILATNIAESSVTIPGVTVVIDSGLQRQAQYSPWHGLKLMEDRPVTQSSAIQRAGRAGRTAPGECFRLYSEQDFAARPSFTVPEIERADLTDTFLLTKKLKGECVWASPPPSERWKAAKILSHRLGAVLADETLTSLGERMLDFPLGARLSRVMLAGEKFVLSEKKKLLRFLCEDLEKDTFLERRLGFYLEKFGDEKGPWEKAILSGFIDQLARFRKAQGDFIHYSGKTFKAHKNLHDLQEGLYVILDITQRQEAISVIEIEEEWLYDIEPFPFVEEDVLEVGEKLSFKRLTKVGSLLMDESALDLTWNDLNEEQKKLIRVQASTAFKKKWERWKETDVYNRLHFWGRFKGIEIGDEVDVLSYLQENIFLNWEGVEEYFQRTTEAKLEVDGLDDFLPEKINLGGRRELVIHYPFGLDPFIEAPIQDFYGVAATPTICRGKVPLSLKLLGPHKRPIQVTKDLSGFWKKTYLEMKRELERDYPRHYWPEDPVKARPVLLKSHLGK